ncbi:MAG: histidine--tRNA ligase [Verrucomicrobiota bacterium]
MAKGFQTLPGFRDFYPDTCAERNYVFDTWRRVAHRYGFVEYEGPILEPTDLYRKKSGNEIVNQLFCFEDKGERDVSMRPELTPTLARMAAARQRDFKKPFRWYSIGQFFRYEKHQKGRGREFYQFNCDIIGENSVAADAELVALAIDLMKEFGFTPNDFKLRLSDRTAWTDFATRSGVSDDDLVEFLQIVDKMERTPPEKLDEALAKFDLSGEKIQSFIDEGAEASDNLKTVVADLEARGLGEFLEIDLSIVRGLAYYTGPVFEVFDVAKGMRAVAGGGRYDDLLKLIGGVDMPACGFAMGDMVIADLVRETDHTHAKMESATQAALAQDVFIVIADEEQRPAATKIAQDLRSAGHRVTFPFGPAKVGKQFQAAEQAGARAAVVIGSEFPEISVKNLADREEEKCSADDLADALAKVL